MGMTAAKFAAALEHTGNQIAKQTEATVRIFFVGAWRDVLGLAPVDTGAHRAAVPYEGTAPPGTFVRRPGDQYPHPGDGLARIVASGFNLGDRIAFSDRARTANGFPYGIMIQPPADRPTFGYPAGSRPAISRAAPRGDYAVVWGELQREFPPAWEAAVEQAMESAQ